MHIFIAYLIFYRVSDYIQGIRAQQPELAGGGHRSFIQHFGVLASIPASGDRQELSTPSVISAIEEPYIYDGLEWTLTPCS